MCPARNYIGGLRRAVARIFNQCHFNHPPVVTISKDRVAGNGDGDRVGRLVGCCRDHTEKVTVGYGEPVRVAAGLYHICRILPVQECVQGGYGLDYARDIRLVD